MENKFKKNKRQKKRKISLVFDAEARREFLTGFHKRKLQRKQRAQDEMKEKLKEERRKIKQNAKEAYKKMVVSHRSVPEVEHLLEEEHDMGTHSVSIVELSANDLAKQNNWIGTNQIQYDIQEETVKSDAESDTELVPGMGLKQKPKLRNQSQDQPKTAKDIKKAVKKQATKQVQKSKIFQLKNKMEKLKSKKKSLQQKKQRGKIHARSKKGRRLNGDS